MKLFGLMLVGVLAANSPLAAAERAPLECMSNSTARVLAGHRWTIHSCSQPFTLMFTAPPTYDDAVPSRFIILDARRTPHNITENTGSVTFNTSAARREIERLTGPQIAALIAETKAPTQPNSR